MTARRVLVVEDHPDHLAILLRRLEAEGVEAVTASTGAAAIALCAAQAFDAAVLDLRLPDLDGCDTLAAMLDARPGLRVLVLSAGGYGETSARALALGARACLLKPVGRAEFVETLNQVWGDAPPDAVVRERTDA